MGRKPRNKAIYSTYYIYQEGKKESLFKNDGEKELFIKVLKKAKDKYNFKLYAFCIMDSSYKLIIFDNGNDITKIMKSINVSYTMRVNRLRNTKGRIFNKRFSSKIIDSGESLLEFSKNIHIDSKKVKECHSSYCIYFNNKKNELIDKDIILKGIKASDSVKKYQMYIDNKEELEDIVCEYNFYECVNEGECLDSFDKSKEKLDNILKEKNIEFKYMLKDKKMRNELIKKFRQNSTLSLEEIGELFGGISGSGICKILSRE